jgi:Putative aminopeptidase
MMVQTGVVALARRCRLAIIILAVTLGGCGGLSVSTIDVGGENGNWAALLHDIRAFERRIGFVDTGNFKVFSASQRAYPFCGHVSRLILPYSYEDPAIVWWGQISADDCRARGRDADVYVGESEALGEISAPVTPAMVGGKLDRFIYLVIHEDCHDQFELPQGFEEALCNLIAYQAMTEFAAEKFGTASVEYQEALRYAETQAAARVTNVHYERLAALYARYERRELAQEALLLERSVLLKNAASAMRRDADHLNNVSMANHMTYSRHYPLVESAYRVLGRDVARTVAFFRQVDGNKPERKDVMKRLGTISEESIEFIRGYESAIAETVRMMIAAAGATRQTGIWDLLRGLAQPRPASPEFGGGN